MDITDPNDPYIGIATYDNMSDNLSDSGGPQWDWDTEHNRAPFGSAVLVDDTYVVFNVAKSLLTDIPVATHCADSFSTTCSTNADCGGALCGRAVGAIEIDRTDILNKAAYRYWDVAANGGAGGFTNVQARDPDPILVAPVEYLANSVSVMKSDALGRWIMIAASLGIGNPQSRALMWIAESATRDALSGPWSGPVVIHENVNGVLSYNPHFIPEFVSGIDDEFVHWSATYQANYNSTSTAHPTVCAPMNYNVELFQTDLFSVKLYCGNGQRDGSCIAGNVGDLCLNDGECGAGGDCLLEDCDDGNLTPNDGCSSTCDYEGLCSPFPAGCAENSDCAGVPCRCAPTCACGDPGCAEPDALAPAQQCN